MTSFSLECPFATFLNLAKHFSKKTCAFFLSGDEPESKPSHFFLSPSCNLEITSSKPNPWDVLKREINSGPWVGYLAYEMGAYSYLDYKLNLSATPIPLASFFKPSVQMTYQNKVLTVHTFHGLENEKKFFLSKESFENFLCQLPSYSLTQDFAYTSLKESDDQKSYISKINQAKEHILKGDIYQLNLSRSSLYGFNQDPFDFFIRLFEINPTPHSCYFNLKEFQLISASPERFLKLSNQILETKPIKGTSKRGQTPSEDQLLKEELVTSSKEASELHMICDLMRNDLGRVSEIGSVKCLHKKQLLELSNVFHLESVIQSKALKKHPIDLIRACFPAGSITGCPKKRAMEIIYDLEQRARHIYCGSMGYILENGDFDFNVAIRTALLKDQLLEVQMGGAITYDSKNISEYNETAYKGGPFYKLLQPVEKALSL